MLPEGGAQPRFSVKFYLVAMLFILFDIEIVFMYPWAVVYREFVAGTARSSGPPLLTQIFWSMLSFVGILTVGYVYAIMKGALDWKEVAGPAWLLIILAMPGGAVPEHVARMILHHIEVPKLRSGPSRRHSWPR